MNEDHLLTKLQLGLRQTEAVARIERLLMSSIYSIHTLVRKALEERSRTRIAK